MMKPAAVRAIAPVKRLAVCESLGREEDDDDIYVFAALLLSRRAAGPRRATSVRNAFSEVKYRADPKPVRRAEGRVPRHNERMGV